MGKQISKILPVTILSLFTVNCGGTFFAAQGGVAGLSSTGSHGSNEAGIESAGTTFSSDGQCAGTMAPRRVWMLSRAEYDNSVAAALGDTTNQAQRNFSNETKLNGFSSNAAGMIVTSGMITSLMDAAETIAAARAGAVVAGLGCTPSSNPKASPMDACVGQFIDKQGKALYRRPLTAVEKGEIYNVYLVGFQNPYPAASAVNSGVQLALTAMLQSPGFLYRTELGDAADTMSASPELTSYEAASALSYLTTSAPPDSTLMALADANKNLSADVLGAQFTRLVNTAAGKDRIAQFFTELMGADVVASLGKASGPLTPSIAGAMLTETKLFIGNAVFSGSGTLKEVLTANYTFANSELAKFYGLTPADDTANFKKIALNPSQRGGLLSQGSFLATSGNSGVPLLHRGQMLRSKMFCQKLPTMASLGLTGFVPPPLGAPVANQSTRQLVEKTIPQGSVCFACHQHFNSLGYALENFDSFGRYRTVDNGVTVDSSGDIAMAKTIDPESGVIVTPKEYALTSFADYQSLMSYYGGNSDVNGCFAKHIMTFASGRADLVNNDCALRSLQAKFKDDSLNILQAFTEYVKSPEFTHRSR
jgi:hypothetical protein